MVSRHIFFGNKSYACKIGKITIGEFKKRYTVEVKMKRKNRRKKNKYIWAMVFLVSIGIPIIMVCISFFSSEAEKWKKPDELLFEYMNYIQQQEYEKMYAMINVEASRNISKEELIKRNSAIYEGIEVQNVTIKVTSYDEAQNTVTYLTSFDTVAGNISFENEASFIEGKEGYELVWNDSLIFPELSLTDKVRVSTTQARRGEILDRNEYVLAGKGVASSVGIVPGKLEDRDGTIQKVANLLEIEPQVIEKKLSAQWVKDDSFVPIKTISKVEEIELMECTNIYIE